MLKRLPHQTDCSKEFYLAYVFFTAIGFYSCERPVYYVSPYNASHTVYHAMPLKRDSLKTAVYAGSTLYIGNANTNYTDKVFQLNANAYQTKQFGIFEAYYGADVSVGNYKVAPFDTSHYYTTRDFQTLNRMAGNKIFEGIGVSGGINIVHPTRRGEWRIIGAELSSHAEAGNYLHFRKTLPDTAANLIIRNANFSTLGFTTETVRKTKNGSYSFKYAYGFVLNKAYHKTNAFDETALAYQNLSYYYSTLTFQYTYNKWTGYLQTTSGAFAYGFNIGAVYHLR